MHTLDQHVAGDGEQASGAGLQQGAVVADAQRNGGGHGRRGALEVPPDEVELATGGDRFGFAGCHGVLGSVWRADAPPVAGTSVVPGAAAFGPAMPRSQGSSAGALPSAVRAR
ncbi:hypothetical protein FQZ97_991100 [compost metagenome]